mgnify:CR=1 FL=1
MIDLGMTGQSLKDQNGQTIGSITEYSLDEELGIITMKINLNEHGKNYIKKVKENIERLKQNV